MEGKDLNNLPFGDPTFERHVGTYPQGYDFEVETSFSLSSSASSRNKNAEEVREEARRSNPNGMTRVSSGISVEQAEVEFAQLRKSLSRAASRASLPRGHDDVESGGTAFSQAESESSDDHFDVEAILRGGLEGKRRAGIRPKHIGVCWDGLTVKGLKSSANYVRTFPDAIIDFFDYYTPVKNMLGLGRKGEKTTLLHDFRGVIKPGEMVLVLGRPGSGCSTFLKNIVNNRCGYRNVTGDVMYGPFSAEQFSQYRGEAVYNQEDDFHHATLTVEQTLGFALDVKIPGKLPAGLTKERFKEEVITTLLKMFNIEHTRHTAVGGPLVRGVSGGERKRVSIAEMLVTNACVLSWDNSTRGLDASTALDFVKSLRIQTDLYKTSTFVSLYQASESIYKLFEKVLVIDGGRQVYFGPTQAARAYFEGLGFAPRPRQTTPDYVTGCTDEFEREYQAGRSANNAPHSPETLETAFRESHLFQLLSAEMAEYKAKLEKERDKYEDFQVAVWEQKMRGASKQSPYTVGFHQQIWALMKRQFVLKMQDRLTLSLAWLRSIAIALILGALYFKLGQTSATAFSKGGLIFFSLLFNAFQAFSEMGTTVLDRPIINKHKAYAFHRPSALWIAQIFVDTAFSASQIFLFSVIVYFMTNLYRSAGAFLTFYLMLLSGSLGMTLFFRILGCISPNFDAAVKQAVVVITFFITTSGYLIQYQSEKVWMRWIYYINVLGLSFSAMMENEFGKIDMTCSAESLIPNGPVYDSVGHQVCTLAGSTPGTLHISGTAYITKGFAFSPQDLWRNWCILFTVIVFFLILNVVVGEFVSFDTVGSAAKVFQKPNAERTKLNEELRRKKEKRRKGGGREEVSGLKIESKSVLTWEDLCYDVPVAGGTRRLLSNVFGYVKPGELTALMGASGAGKTTLLDVLAGRKNVGLVSGGILVDGQKPGKEFQRSTSYAEQIDVHNAMQTVREALRFSADLRQAIETPQADKYAFVEEIIALLEMENFADAIIGSPEAGLTVEERKRVTIGVELAAKPQLLLFLDEPTSGLDSQSAFNIVRFLKKLAAAGQAILCTIHQPNAALFESFDRLLLLKSGGRCVYFGDIGKDAVVLRNYLKQRGAEAGATDNVAEYMLEVIGAGSRSRVGDRDWADLWEESSELGAIKETIVRMKSERMQWEEQTVPVMQREFASPTMHQLKVVTRRMNISYWRSPDYLFTRLFNQIIIAVITGLTFLSLDNSRSSLQYKVFVMFQVTVLPALLLPQVEVMYNVQRMIYYREESSRMYNSLAFVLSMVIAEAPYSVLCAVGFFLPLYYIPGLQTEASRAGYQFFMVLVTEFFSVTLAQALAALTPSVFVSSQFDPFLMITFSLVCGVTIYAPDMPSFWRSWLYEVDPFTRLIGGAVVTALHGLEVVCNDKELNRFNAPSGQTCGQYMAPFFEQGGAGYIVKNDTSACEYCAYRVGDQFYERLDLSFDNRWRDLGIFIAFCGTNLVILVMAARFLSLKRR